MLLYGIKDDRGCRNVSVTDVDVSGGSTNTPKILSVSMRDVKAETMAGLKSVTGFVRSELGSGFACAGHQKLCL